MSYKFKSVYPINTDFQQEYDNLIKYRKKNKVTYKVEEHHIKPRCFFTKEDEHLMNIDSNLVNLKRNEHFMAHYFLFEIYKNDRKYHIRAEKMFESMRMTLIHYKDDLSMKECAIIYEQNKLDYDKILEQNGLEKVKENR